LGVLLIPSKRNEEDHSISLQIKMVVVEQEGERKKKSYLVFLLPGIGDSSEDCHVESCQPW
jgi:predicted metal-binding protein